MTDTERAEYNDVVQKLTMRLEQAVGEIDRLRAVVAKLTGTDDAHSTLRRLYLDETQNPNVRVRAAQAAIGHESPSLKPVSQLELSAEPAPLPLAEVVRLQRARCERMWREDPQFDEVRSRTYLPKGNGSDSSDQ